MIGQCTTSAMPAAINASTPVSLAQAAASRIGTFGATACSAAANSASSTSEMDIGLF
jgi:hypothetical protein